MCRSVLVLFLSFIVIEVRPVVSLNAEEILELWNSKKLEAKQKLSPLNMHKDVILLLGRTGVGKSTVASFLAGVPVRTLYDPIQEEVMINDEHQRISNGSTVRSYTIVPEALVNNKTNVVYVDCPGFDDTRGPEYDISVTYFIRKMLNSVKTVKILILLSANAVDSNGDRNDFLILARHITALIRDVKKYGNGMALIITKVPNELRRHRLIGDQVYIERAVRFLSGTKSALEGMRETKKREIIDLIDVILENGGRIGVLKKLDTEGLIQDDPSWKEEGQAINIIIDRNLDFIRINRSDFDYAVSAETKIYLNDLIAEKEQHIRSDVRRISAAFKNWYLEQEKALLNLKDWNIFQEKIDLGRQKISLLDSSDLHVFVRELHSVIADLKIRSAGQFNEFHQNVEFVVFLYEVSRKSWSMPSDVGIEMKNSLTIFLNEFEEWYHLMNSTYRAVIDYANDLSTPINQLRELTASSTLRVEDLRRIFELIPPLNNTLIIGLNELSASKAKMLLEILENVNYKDIRCTSSEEIVAKGYNIRVSELFESHCWATVKSISVFALNMLFVDANFDMTGKRAKLVFIAPTWNIVPMDGNVNVTIVINGADGEPYANVAENTDGRKGRPGGPAGSFIGIGTHFINSRHLQIIANGGLGGPGQNGGDG